MRRGGGVGRTRGLAVAGCFAPRHAAAVRSRLRRSELPENIGFRPYFIFHSPSGKAARFGRYGAARARHAPRPPRESANRRGCPRGWDREREEVQAAYTPPHRRAPRDRRAGAPTARARDFRLRLPCPKGSNRRGRMPPRFLTGYPRAAAPFFRGGFRFAKHVS